MGIATNVLRTLGWVPGADLPLRAPEGILLPSYGGLRNEESVPPLTQAVDAAAACLYHQYGKKPFIVFAIPDFSQDDERIEVAVRKRFLEERGVTREKIFAAYKTHDTASEAREMIHIVRREAPQIRSVIVCLHELHVRRGLPVYRGIAGSDIAVYANPVRCNTYTNCRMPIWWRRWSVRSETIFAFYMVTTWAMWKVGLIR